MPIQTIVPQPGICKVQSDYVSGKTNRYTGGDKVRFIAGFPEKIGGYLSANVANLLDTPRAMAEFRDTAGGAHIVIGTESHLYDFNGTTITDITPLRTISTGTLTNALTTVGSSFLVAVADSSQNLQNGDHVFLSAASQVGGLTISGWYTVSSRTASGYNITSAIVAPSSQSSGGGTITFNYPRVLLGNNPFSTTNGSKTVTVTHTSHGATTGDYVDFGGATAVAGLTLNGEFQLTVVNANSYTIQAASNANATTTGGGAAVNVTYDVTLGQFSVPGLGTPYGGTGVVYGVGPYGYAQSSIVPGPKGWTLAAYGGFMLACVINGTIYVYDPVSAGGRAAPLSNAPSQVLAMFVTPERFVFALGINNNTLQLAWCDQLDFTQWTTTATNTANSGRSLQGGMAFVAGIKVAHGISLLFTNTSVFAATYTGDSFIYQTPLISEGSAGLIGPQAATTMNGVAFWMSGHDFWMYNGVVTALPSDDIRDYVFSNLNPQAQAKCFAASVRDKKEVWFFYPSTGATEVDSYVIFHVPQQCWSIGTLSRTAWNDSELFNYPYATSTSGMLFQHELGTDANGAVLDASIFFGPLDVSNGTMNMDIFGFIPDFERLTGNISLTVRTKYYPQDSYTVDGPFTITAIDTTPRIDLRSAGKAVALELESNTLGGDFRLGLIRIDAQPSGARR